MSHMMMPHVRLMTRQKLMTDMLMTTCMMGKGR